jgi:glycerophosphoryl diester phosphodiesterase
MGFCRHAECDLHTTTNIVATPLNAKCSVPWAGPGSSPKCCTSDLSLAEFKTLQGKMDAANPAATTAEGFLGGTPSWRTDLYTGRGTLFTFKESIRLNESNGVQHTPELKEAMRRVSTRSSAARPHAQKMTDEFKLAGINPKHVGAVVQKKRRSVLDQMPRFGKQAVYLDSIDPTVTPPTSADAGPAEATEEGEDHRTLMFALLGLNADDEIVPSQYSVDIKGLGFDIITWTFERSDLRHGAVPAGFYYLFDPEGRAVKKDSDMYKALDALARQVGILGIFSDWAATVTYYANCMGLK